MTWGNPPKLEPAKPKQGKKITPEDLAGESESSQQKALFLWAASARDKYPQLKYLFHIPNGGLRDMRTAVNLKAEGVRAGVPDVMLPYGCGFRLGLFIEMKVGKNKPSLEQVDWINYLNSAGYECRVCYSWEDARDAIVKYLND